MVTTMIFAKYCKKILIMLVAKLFVASRKRNGINSVARLVMRAYSQTTCQ